MQKSSEVLLYYQPIFLCFRERNIMNSSDSSCYFGNSDSNYQCLTSFFNDTLGSFENYQWVMDSTYKTIQTAVKYVPLLNTSYASAILSVQLNGKVNGSSFSFLPIKSTIYEVLSAITDLVDEYDPLGDYPLKTNYINTHVAYFDVPSDNLLMQRQALCFKKGNFISLVFLGGVVRDSVSYYLVAFVTYDPHFNNFQTWTGLSFSRDKVRRDMVGVIPATAQVDDLYSIYAAAPFLDTSTNVNGTEDWITEASSDKIGSGNAGSFYYTQISRKYNTEDAYGDEAIMFKIKNKYCHAAYFTYNTNVTPSYLSSTYMHQVLECFAPDISLHALHLFPFLSLLILLAVGWV